MMLFKTIFRFQLWRRRIFRRCRLPNFSTVNSSSERRSTKLLQRKARLKSRRSPSCLVNNHRWRDYNFIMLDSYIISHWLFLVGVAWSDKPSVLRGQILLLHNQLMYERHKRELFAKRNRRLLGRIVHNAALEERTTALVWTFTMHSSWNTLFSRDVFCFSRNRLACKRRSLKSSKLTWRNRTTTHAPSPRKKNANNKRRMTSSSKRHCDVTLTSVKPEGLL